MWKQGFLMCFELLYRCIFKYARTSSHECFTERQSKPQLKLARRCGITKAFRSTAAPHQTLVSIMESSQKSFSAQAGFTSSKVYAAYFPNVNRQKSGDLEIWFCCFKSGQGNCRYFQCGFHLVKRIILQLAFQAYSLPTKLKPDMRKSVCSVVFKVGFYKFPNVNQAHEI